MTILKLKKSQIKEKLSSLRKNLRLIGKNKKKKLLEKEVNLNNRTILPEIHGKIIDEYDRYCEHPKKTFEYDNNYLPIREYMVEVGNKSADYNNLIINNSMNKMYLSSSNSEEMKFYSIDYNNDDFNRESKIEDENMNPNSRNFIKCRKYPTKVELRDLKSSDFDKSSSNKKDDSLIDPTTSSSCMFFPQKNPNHANKKLELSLDNVNLDNSEEYINSEELHMLFLKIRHLMKKKYTEYKELTNVNNCNWVEYGSKNGIKFFRKRDGINNSDKYTTIRGIIEVNLNKENDSFYEELKNKRKNYRNYKKCTSSGNHHLGDLVTPKEFVNYLWNTDPLTYDNTVDNSYRVHTWSDGNPGYCVYYHSYKGALGVQGRDFLLFGYKNNCETQSYGHLTKLTTSSSLNSIYSSISNIRNSSSIASPYSVTNTNERNETGNSSNNRYLRLPIKAKRKFNIKKNRDSMRNDSVHNNDEIVVDSSFFISSDLIMELSENNLYKLICEKNNTPSFIRGRCYLNGVKIDKLLNKDNQRIVRMDIIWIGDLNGKLPEFIKKSLLYLSIGTMKVLKDKYIELKKKELLDILENNN